MWLTTGAYGTLRNTDSRMLKHYPLNLFSKHTYFYIGYTAAWTPFFSKVSKIISEHLITNGGNVILYQIENEFGSQWTSVSKKIPNLDAENYMALLEACARENGIDIPLMANAPNMNAFSWSKDFSNDTGNTDVVGLDSYPSCWSCNLNECTGVNGVYVAYVSSLEQLLAFLHSTNIYLSANCRLL